RGHHVGRRVVRAQDRGAHHPRVRAAAQRRALPPDLRGADRDARPGRARCGSRADAAVHADARALRPRAPRALALDAPALARRRADVGVAGAAHGAAPGRGRVVTAPSRVVVRAPDWLGDVVMAAPSILAVRRAWPDAAVDVALPAPFVPLVPMIDASLGAVPLAGKGMRGLAAQRADADRLRSGAYDLAVLFTNSFGSAWV